MYDKNAVAKREIKYNLSVEWYHTINEFNILKKLFEKSGNSSKIWILIITVY